MYDSLIYVNTNRKIIKNPKDVLTKLCNLPKKFNDKMVLKRNEIKLFKYKILSKIFDIFKYFCESKLENLANNKATDYEDTIKNTLVISFTNILFIFSMIII